MAADYEALRREVTWDLARHELGLGDGEPVNIGWLCVDRHVDAGTGDFGRCFPSARTTSEPFPGSRRPEPTCKSFACP